MRLAVIPFAISCLTLAACSGIEPPPRVITVSGVPAKITKEEFPEGPDSLAQRFRSDFANAADIGGDQAIYAMIRSGTMMVYANCDLYFSEKGTGQQRSRVMRAAITPISAVLTGAIGLINMKDTEREDLLAILAIGSAAGAAGLDIYEQHFLFDADNIQGVRKVTLEAITSHRDLVLKQKRLMFEDGVMHLMDIQAICTPAHILTLVRASIENSKIVDSKTGKTAEETQDPTKRRINVTPAGGDVSRGSSKEGSRDGDPPR